MKTLTKKEIVNSIAEEFGFTQQEVKEIVQRFIDTLGEQLIKGNRVELREFGVFSIKKRKAKLARNPMKPKIAIKVPARFIPVFKPGRNLKIRIAKGLGSPK